MKLKITKEVVESIVPSKKSYEIHDTEIKGFLIRVWPSGTATYMLAYRFRGKKGRVTIGRCKNIKTGQAREAAKNILADLIKGIDPGEQKRELKRPLPEPPELPKIRTLKSFLDDDYESWCKAHKDDGENTIKRIRTAFAELLDMPLLEIDSLSVSRWRTKRLEAGKAATTINRDVNAIRSLFTTALKWKFIDVHPLNGFEQLKDKGIPLTRYLSADEEKWLYEVLDAREKEKAAGRERGNTWRKERNYQLYPDAVADPLRPMINISLHTGIRWGSLAQLEWSDIDFEKALLTVRKEVEKTKQNRYIPLNSKVLETLKEWKKATKKEEQPAGSNLIFPSKSDEVRDNVKKSFNRVKELAGIKNFRWHDLRHTFASKLVMKGVDLNTVRELLGHSDIKMTLRYAHLAPEHKAAAVAVLV